MHETDPRLIAARQELNTVREMIEALGNLVAKGDPKARSRLNA